MQTHFYNLKHTNIASSFNACKFYPTLQQLGMIGMLYTHKFWLANIFLLSERHNT